MMKPSIEPVIIIIICRGINLSQRLNKLVGKERIFVINRETFLKDFLK